MSNEWWRRWTTFTSSDARDGDETPPAPGPVDNTDVMEPKSEGDVAQDRMEGMDFHLVPEEAWEELKKSYGVLRGHEMARNVIQQGSGSARVTNIELFPQRSQVGAGAGEACGRGPRPWVLTASDAPDAGLPGGFRGKPAGQSSANYIQQNAVAGGGPGGGQEGNPSPRRRGPPLGWGAPPPPRACASTPRACACETSLASRLMRYGGAGAPGARGGCNVAARRRRARGCAPRRRQPLGGRVGPAPW